MTRPRSGTKDFRFSVSVSEEMRQLLDEFALLTGQPRASLASELLEETKPILREMLVTFRRFADEKEKGLESIRQVVNDYAQESLKHIYQVGADFNAQIGSDSESAATGTSQEK